MNRRGFFGFLGGLGVGWIAPKPCRNKRLGVCLREKALMDLRNRLWEAECYIHCIAEQTRGDRSPPLKVWDQEHQEWKP